MDYQTLQSEHKAWITKMYPDQEVWLPACGLVEESGELLQAYIKQQRELKWGAEGLHNRHRELVDAVGDCGIYVCSLCNANGWIFDTVMARDSGVFFAGRTVRHTLLATVRHAVAVAEMPTELGTVAAYVSCLMTAAERLSVDFDEALFTTWNEVKQRCR